MAKSGLSEHDPYRNMETGAQGVRPGFLSGGEAGGVSVDGGGGASGGGDGGSGGSGGRGGKLRGSHARDDSEAGAKAAEDLKNAEGAASGGLFHHEDGLDGTRQAENAAGGFYSDSSKSRGRKRGKHARKMDIKGGAKGLFRRKGPVTLILLTILTVGGVMAGTQVFQPFSLVAQLQESFNSMHISANARSTRFLRWQLDGGRAKNPVKGTVFGSTLKITDKQNEQLKRQGIEFDENFNGSGKRVFKYDDGKGEIKIITANAGAAESLGDLSGVDTGVEGKKYAKSATSFDTFYRTNSDFFRAYNAGSMTWRGQFANWFGSKTSEFLKTNKLTRNLWNDWEKVKKSATNRIDAVKDKIKKRITDGESGGFRRVTEEEKVDADGNPIDEDGDGNTDTEKKNKDTGNSKTGADAERIQAKLESIKGTISGGANVACGVADFIGIVSLMVVAEEAQQIITLSMAYVEAVDKTKAGYGDEAPINEMQESINAQTKVSHPMIVDGDGGTVVDGNESMEVGVVTETKEGQLKSAMQGEAVAALYGNGYANPKDPSVQSFNLTANISKVTQGVGMSMESFAACALARTAAAAISIGVDVATCALTLGAGCVANLFRGIVFQAALGLAINAAIGILVPWLTDVFKRDLIGTLAGEDYGNAIVFGGLMSNGLVHKSNGGSLMSRDRYTKFAVARQQVIAEDARYERETLSPFDLTSKNTFMGSIMTQLMSFNTTNSLMSTLTSVGSTMSSAVTNLAPQTSAIASEIAESLPTEEEYEETCPYLASIGAVGDSACNPYMGTDMGTEYDNGTIDMDPADVIDVLADPDGDGDISDGIFEDKETSDGNVVLKKDSDFMDYAHYCLGRTSAFGIADQNYANEFKASTGNSTADTILGVMPIVGDLMDIYDSEETMKYAGYIDGESCVAGNDVGGDAPNWETAQYYQRFAEDQSLAESMGIINESAVTVALREYYEENPLDDSYEGQLARWSGLTKETVSDVLDIIAYYDYLNNYDASERYGFGAPVVEEGERVVLFEHENVMESEMPALEGVVYADVRNRTFVI